MSPAVQNTRYPRRLWFAIFINVVYLFWIKFHPVPPVLFKGINDCYALVISLLGAWWGLEGIREKGRLRTSRRQAWAANLAGGSVLFYAMGMVCWCYYEILRHREVPFPSWADVYYLTSYSSLLIGVLLMPTRPIPSAQRGRVLLDSLMMLTGLVTFSWYFLLGPTVLQGSQTLLGRILGVGYPLEDLAILFCLLVLSAHPAETPMRPSRWLLGWGISVFVVADAIYGYMNLQGTYVTGQYIDALWPLGNLLIGLGVAAYRRAAAPGAQEGNPTSELRAPSLWQVLLPYAFVPAVVVLLWYMLRHTGDEKLESGVYIGSATLIVLIGLRQVLALLDNNRLYRCLQEAYREQEADRRSLAATNAQLETLAATDGLTGLKNHLTFQERLAEAYADTAQSNAPLSLLLLDVDKFKQFNDTHGHPAGDTVLKQVARILLNCARETDVVARYGGEEFSIILTGTPAGEAIQAAEQIRRAIENAEWTHRAITVSIGISTFQEQRTTPADLVQEADKALYFSKQAGRNCSTHWNSMQPEAEELRGNLTRPYTLILAEMMQMQTDTLNSASAQIQDVMTTAYDATIVSWSRLLDLKDKETEGHSERVTETMLKMANQIGMNAEELLYARWGALLHDVGKMGVPDAILHKPGSLTEEEWVIMRSHTTLAYDLLSPVSFLRPALDIPFCHHEKWDGTGYPRGLSGDDIPLSARLFALADVYDALTNDRPYRSAWTHEEAVAHIDAQSGTHFDPRAVKVFLSVMQSEESSHKKAA